LYLIVIVWRLFLYSLCRIYINVPQREHKSASSCFMLLMVLLTKRFRNLKWNDHVARIGKLRTHAEFCWKYLPDNVHLEDEKGDDRMTLHVSYGGDFRGSGLSENDREFDYSLKANF
jgi:hypothetical protein